MFLKCETNETNETKRKRPPELLRRPLFARERRSRERFNCCVAEKIAMPTGSFFDED